MIEPLGNRVLIKMKKIKEITSGGLYIPENAKFQRQMAEMECEIMALGDEAFVTHKVKPAVGDTVLISKHSGLQYPQDGEDWRIIDDVHIQAVVR